MATQIAGQAGQVVRVGRGGLGLEPIVAQPDVPGVQSGDSVFYANVDTDALYPLVADPNTALVMTQEWEGCQEGWATWCLNAHRYDGWWFWRVGNSPWADYAGHSWLGGGLLSSKSWATRTGLTGARGVLALCRRAASGPDDPAGGVL